MRANFLPKSNIIKSIAIGVVLLSSLTSTFLIAELVFVSDAEKHYFSSARLIDTQNRQGADLYPDINNKFVALPAEELISAVQTINNETPTAIGHEILATAYFLASEFNKAESELKTAISLEDNASGPHTKLGVLALRRNQIAEASAHFMRAISINEKDRYAHQRLGYIFEQQGQLTDAEKHYSAGLIGIDKAQLGVSVDLARVLNKQRKFEQAVSVLEPRLAIDSNNSEAHMVLATSLLGSSEYEKALERFELANVASPYLLGKQIGISRAQRALGRFNDSLTTLEAAVSDNPDSDIAYLELGETLLRLDRVSEAEQAFDTAVTLGAESIPILNRLARYHLSKGETDRPEELYRNAINNGQADEAMYLGLVEILQSEGNYVEGIKILNAAMQSFPDSKQVAMRIAAFHATFTRYEESVAAYKDWLNRFGDDARILFAMGVAQVKADQIQDALTTAKQLYRLDETIINGIFLAERYRGLGLINEAFDTYQALESKFGEHPIVLNNLAVIEKDRGNFAEAESLALKAVNGTQRQNGAILDTLAQIQFEQQKYPEAVETFREAIRALPNSGALYYRYGLALIEVGQKVAAIDAWKKAEEIAPSAMWIEEMRSKRQALRI